MSFLADNILALILLGFLLVLSALFSGSETVLFSLTKHDRTRMKKSGNRLEVLAASLLENPRSLITTLMIGNQGCNILFFVISTVLLTGGASAAAADEGGRTWGEKAAIAFFAILPPLLVTYVSDVFPKVIGALNNVRIAPLIALPIATLVRFLYPVSYTIDILFMRPMHRIVSGGRSERVEDFSTGELRELLEMSEERGVIDVSENELLQEVVRIGDLRVRDVMTPRVDLLAYNIKDPPEKLLEMFAQSHLAKLPVYEGQIDNVLGLVYAKEFFLAATDASVNAASGGVNRIDVRKMLRPAQFVPDVLTLDRLITRFRQTRTQIAVAVDEFGAAVGVVALEDVVEQMVGEIYEPHDRPEQAIQKTGADEYRVPGDLSVADWSEAFGILRMGRLEGAHISTVAGLLASVLKRVPRAGDQVRFGHLLMTVERMRGRRVDAVKLKLVDSPEVEERGTIEIKPVPAAQEGGRR